MTHEGFALEQRARRIGITLEALKEIETAVTFDSNANGGFLLSSSPEMQRERIGQAVSIYCAVLVAESQK